MDDLPTLQQAEWPWAVADNGPAMSFDEIAKALGLAKPTVVVTYHRAMRKIREQLGVEVDELR